MSDHPPPLTQVRSLAEGVLEDVHELLGTLAEPDFWCDPALREHAYAHLGDLCHQALALGELRGALIDIAELDALTQLAATAESGGP